MFIITGNYVVITDNNFQTKKKRISSNELLAFYNSTTFAYSSIILIHYLEFHIACNIQIRKIIIIFLLLIFHYFFFQFCLLRCFCFGFKRQQEKYVTFPCVLWNKPALKRLVEFFFTSRIFFLTTKDTKINNIFLKFLLNIDFRSKVDCKLHRCRSML